jgi:hypothetical protein
MKKAAIPISLFCVWISILLACANPMGDFLTTRTFQAATSTAAMWTATPTATGTPTPRPTATPTATTTLVPSATPDPRFHEAKGAIRFSYNPPQGWDQKFGEGLTGWWSTDISCDLEFVLVKLETDLSTFQTAFWRELAKQYKFAGGGSGGDFLSDTDVEITKSVSWAKKDNAVIRLSIFYFQKDTNLLIAIYGRPAELHQEFDDVVDQSMRSLRFEQ